MGEVKKRSKEGRNEWVVIGTERGEGMLRGDIHTDRQTLRERERQSDTDREKHTQTETETDRKVIQILLQNSG